MNAADVGYVAGCPNCGFALWCDPTARRAVMCVCGGLVINADGLDERTSVTPQPINAELLQAILDYNYAPDPTGMINPEQSVVDAWRAHKRGE